ncbi:MAG: hypothetical protein O3B13_04265 [Planctomycetota bacterium]|nr:hypothetical protein [Planctomycetota bacterium]MDA1162297.1 hypothetical protein [Planctomycetota bacterium]
MNFSGRVENGVVVLEGRTGIPDGTRVTVVVEPTPAVEDRRRERIQLPLVRSANPGSLDLTGDRIAEIFEQEDIERLRSSDDVSA